MFKDPWLVTISLLDADAFPFILPLLVVAGVTDISVFDSGTVLCRLVRHEKGPIWTCFSHLEASILDFFLWKLFFAFGIS